MNISKKAELALSQGKLNSALGLYEKIPTSQITINDLLNRASVRIALNLELDLAEDDLRSAKENGCKNLYALNHNLGWLYAKQRRFSEAIESYTKALCIMPDATKTLINRGSVYALNIDANAAIKDYKKVISLDPSNTMAQYNLGNIYKKINYFEEAVNAYEKCLAINPDNLDALNNMAGALNSLGDLEKGINILRDVLSKANAPYAAFSNYLFAITHSELHTPEEIFKEHIRIGELIEKRINTEILVKRTTYKKNNERIRLGILSGDLRNHAVSNFFWKTYEAIDTNRFEIHIFYNYFVEDSITAKYRNKAAFFLNIYNKPDQSVVDAIQEAQLNILLDLSGHTGYSKVYLMALRLAPIQISGIGYPGTTGISAVDYYMHSVDKEIWNAVKDQFIENGIHLDSTGSFTLKSQLPQLKPKPAIANKFLTIGIFINTRKYNNASWNFWTSVAKRFKDLRFVFLGVSEIAIENQIRLKMKAAGAIESHIILKPKLKYEDYLEAHNEVDLLLDSCIYTGGTSAISAILMGTPLISVTRNTLCGYSNLEISRMYGITGNCCSSVDEALTIIDTLINQRNIFIQLPQKMRTIAISRLKKAVIEKKSNINTVFEELIEKADKI